MEYYAHAAVIVFTCGETKLTMPAEKNSSYEHNISLLRVSITLLSPSN